MQYTIGNQLKKETAYIDKDAADRLYININAGRSISAKVSLNVNRCWLYEERRERRGRERGIKSN